MVQVSLSGSVSGFTGKVGLITSVRTVFHATQCGFKEATHHFKVPAAKSAQSGIDCVTCCLQG